MSNIIPFKFNSEEVRVLTDEQGDPWFVAKDIADILGYANTSKAINSHCKGVTTCPTEMGGQVRHVQIIPERDVYRLIMRSKLPAAEAFEEWVVSEVLPSIRKTGGYAQIDVSKAPIALLQDLVSRIASAEQQRDDAIKTKAYISDKKTATAMATAAAQKKRADRLEQELGKNTTFKATKSVDWITVLFAPSRAMWSQIGKYFKKLSSEMEYEVIQIEDSAYGAVNAYHIDVITEAYKRIKKDGSILSKYRASKKIAA